MLGEDQFNMQEIIFNRSRGNLDAVLLKYTLDLAYMMHFIGVWHGISEMFQHLLFPSVVLQDVANPSSHVEAKAMPLDTM